MDQETANEFVDRQGHLFLLVVILVIAPLERHCTIFQLQDAVIRNCDAVRVPAEIFHHTTCVFERGLAVHHPFLLVQGRHPVVERNRIFQVYDRTIEVEFGLFQIVKKLAPELV